MPNKTSRRLFLQSTALAALALKKSHPLLAATADDAAASLPSIRLQLYRRPDRLFAQLEAIGFRLGGSSDRRYLARARKNQQAFLIFSFPSQHYAETAVPLAGDLPSTLPDKLIDAITLIPSNPARIVLEVPPGMDRVNLSLQSLLDWSRYHLLLPDLDELAQTFGKTRANFIGVDWFGAEEKFSRQSVIDMPWGIYLQPLGTYGTDYAWHHPLTPITHGSRSELWRSSLQNLKEPGQPLQFEVLDVHGLTYHGATGKATDYIDEDSYTGEVKNTVECSPTTNWDRLEVAASLSRRFLYTGKPDANLAKSVETDQLTYNGGPQTGACYEKDRSLSITSYAISSLGGFLQVDAKWEPKSGCALKAWQHTAVLGRDQHVEYTRLGWLYPLGLPAELVILSEREFVRDDSGHFVAPLFKQAFIQIPTDNSLEIQHPESPFTALRILTSRTPPLDLPKSGNVIDYAMCDYFLPVVGGVAFPFEYTGSDHEGGAAKSRMPMFFVSNKARQTNGLIFEEHSSFNATPVAIPARPPSSVQCAAVATVPGTTTPLLKYIPRSKAADPGLRVVDNDWQLLPFRFSHYNSQRVAVAPASKSGNTTNELEWIEWVRGQQPLLEDGIAPRPFHPRTRVMRIIPTGIGHFSGRRNSMLASYRDLRFMGQCILDPEPTITGDPYYENCLEPAAAANTVGAYLYVLPLEEINTKAPNKDVWHPFAPEVVDRPTKVRNIYYGRAHANQTHPIPASLFANLDNEVSFGTSNSTEATAAIVAPDSPIGLFTWENGPTGDAVSDPKRWKEATPQAKFAIPANRADYVSFRLLHRAAADNALDVPFDLPDQASGKYPACVAMVEINGLVSRPSTPRSVDPSSGTGQNASIIGVGDVGSLFGADAELLPGVRLSKVFEGVGLVPASTYFTANTPTRSSDSAAAPKWDFRVTGLDWLLESFGNGADQIPLADAVQTLTDTRAVAEPAEPLEFGLEAHLDWQTNAAREVDLGIVVFRPKNSVFSVSASAKIALEGAPAITAVAELRDFSLLVLNSLDVGFVRVAFQLNADGSKRFTPEIGEVQFVGALSFISNLQQMLKSLLKDYGIVLNVTPQKVEVSQKIQIPPAAGNKKGGTFLLGPATITNLSLQWGVRIPILGRDVVTVWFGLASREDPLIIYVPPWYGGKAHALIETTSQSIRLFECSIEFGAIIFAEYSIARGEVSFMAGMQFSLAQTNSGTTFTLCAFVKVTGSLLVASIIEFNGLIFVSLDYQQGGGGSKLAGEATVTVSMKIGFIRISYSFTARHEENRQDAKGQVVDFAPHIAPADADLLSAPSDATVHVAANPVRYPFADPELADGWARYIAKYGE